MSFAERLRDPGWLMTALLLLGMILLIVALRIREAVRIRGKFPRGSIVLASYAVTYYGLDSEPGPIQRIVGALLLHKDGLYFRARAAKRELSIPRTAVIRIEPIDTHRNRYLRLYAVGIRFRTSEGGQDTAAFRLARPARWIAALQTTLLEGRA